MRPFLVLSATIGLGLLVVGCSMEAGPAPVAAPDVESAPSRALACEETVAEPGSPAPAAESPESTDAARGVSGPETPRIEAEARTEEDRRRSSDADRRQYPRSGQLTAGSIDDVQRSDEFCRFVDRTLQSWILPGKIRDVRPRVVFQVTTPDGQPVGGAELTIEPGQRRLQLTTGSDGRAMATVSDLDRQSRSVEVAVRPPNGGEPLRQQLLLDGEICHITVPGFESRRPQRLDLALIIDTTGSMGDELEYLKREIDSIVARLRETFPNVDQRFALIVYRDQGDQYVSRTFDFTRSLDDLRGELSRQRAAGGGDHPEAVHTALQQAAGLDWRPGNIARVAFLVGDAPPHDHDLPDAFEATGGLRTRGVRLFPVASSGVDLKAEFLMRSAAFLTMGQYLFLTDHSGIGNPHARPHTSQYLVEYLDQLMVRMIASELCGRRLQPDEVLAIERGDMELPYGPGPIPLEEWQHRQPPSRTGQAAFMQIPEGAGMWLTFGAALLGVCLYDSLRSREDA